MKLRNLNPKYILIYLDTSIPVVISRKLLCKIDTKIYKKKVNFGAKEHEYNPL